MESDPPINTTARGTFTDTTDLTLDASLMVGSCTYDVAPTAFSFLL